MGLDLSGHHVARDDAPRPPADENDIEHLGARVHGHAATTDLSLERLVGAQQQLLPSLPARIERPRHLRAAERPVGEEAAVLASERHALSDTLIYDIDAYLSQSINVR